MPKTGSNVDSQDVSAVTTATASAVLPTLVRDLSRLGCHLDVHNVDEGRWTHVLRTLHTVNTLQECRLIAVAGGQGAGKTTLIRSLYPAAGPWLIPNEGRGERIPIAVVERRGIEQVRGVVLHRELGSAEPGLAVFGPEDVSAWEHVVRGRDPRSLMVRVEVPLSIGFWQQEDSGFILLPGLERLADSDWQLLMRVVLVTSSAAVVVTDENRMAHATQVLLMSELVSDVRTAGVEGGRAVDVLIALNRCDDKTPEAIASVLQRATELFGAGDCRVVPFGATPDAPPGWPARFESGIENLLPAAVHSRRLEANLLRTIVRKDVGDVIALARRARDQIALDSIGSRDVAALMAVYDEHRDHLLETLGQQLQRKFGDYFKDAWNALDQQFATERWSERWGEHGRRQVVDRVKLTPEARYQRINQLVRAVWKSSTVDRLHGECLDAVVRQGLRFSGGDTATADDLAPLLQIERLGPGAPNLRRAISLLPVLSLSARRLLAADSADGRHDVDVTLDSPYWKRVDDRAAALDPTSQALLVGVFGLLSAAALDADGGPSGEGGLNGLFSGTSIVMTALQQTLGMGAIHATGLSAAWAAPLAGVLAVGLALREGNRAMRDRTTCARDLLGDLHATAAQQARGRVEEVFRLTRIMLESRLTAAFRLGDAETRALALLQATRDVERSRAQLLGVLSESMV